MLFKREFHNGIQSGAITMTIRRWSRPQVREGGRYKTTAGMLEVDEVASIRVRDIRSVDARRCGFADRTALLEAIAGGRGSLAPNDTVYRVCFRYGGEREAPEHHADLSDEELEALAARLDNMDGRSQRGAWTRAMLELIRKTHGRALPISRSGSAARTGRSRRTCASSRTSD